MEEKAREERERGECVCACGEERPQVADRERPPLTQNTLKSYPASENHGLETHTLTHMASLSLCSKKVFSTIFG